MINGLDNWQCPECGYIPEGMMDVIDAPDGEHDGSICPACKKFVATKDWVVLSEDELLDELGFGGMDELEFDDDSEARYEAMIRQQEIEGLHRCSHCGGYMESLDSNLCDDCWEQ
jgi:hypothetical protein